MLLVPLAMAGAAAIKAATDRKADGVCRVGTRMRDTGMLGDALRDTGADVRLADDTATVRWADGVTAGFTREADGLWSAHFSGTDQAGAIRKVSEVDAAYGRLVQKVVLERLREQAPAAGLRLESETVEEDASVRMVFEIAREQA
jgi:hypothetical protein